MSGAKMYSGKSQWPTFRDNRMLVFKLIMLAFIAAIVYGVVTFLRMKTL